MENKKIKVVYFDQAVAFGGTIVVLAHLFAHLDRQQFTPLLISAMPDEVLAPRFDARDRLAPYNLKMTYATRLQWMEKVSPRNPLAKKLWAYTYSVVEHLANLAPAMRLFLTLARERPDVLHINNGQLPLLFCWLLRIPVVFQMHGSFATSKVGRDRFQPRQFVAISEFIRQGAIGNGYRPEKIMTLHNPAPDYVVEAGHRASWRRQHGFSDEQLLIGHVGRLVRWKGQLEFLQAFALFARTHPEAIALIVGADNEFFLGGYKAQLEQFVADQGLGKQVVFVGHVSGVNELMAACDIVVHSSIEPEPFGLVITEAMNAGAAVIAATLGAPGEIIEQGRDGLLVDPLDTQAFAGALHRLAEDEPFRRSAIAAARDKIKRLYSGAAFARRMESVYRQVSQLD